MQNHSTPSSRRSRRARLLGGALIGAVLSIGIVGGQASAAKPVASKVSAAVTDAESPAAPPSFARAFGIRW